jgi:hypothetical protein
MKAIAACASVLALFVCAAPAQAHYVPGQHNAKHAIVGAWCKSNRLDQPCPRGAQALRVAYCETGGTFSPWAGIGKHRYWGLFQVSDHWRSTVRGWAMDPWSQAEHAHRVYVLTRGWGHWECAYLIGLL